MFSSRAIIFLLIVLCSYIPDVISSPHINRGIGKPETYASRVTNVIYTLSPDEKKDRLTYTDEATLKTVPVKTTRKGYAIPRIGFSAKTTERTTDGKLPQWIETAPNRNPKGPFHLDHIYTSEESENLYKIFVLVRAFPLGTGT